MIRKPLAELILVLATAASMMPDELVLPFPDMASEDEPVPVPFTSRLVFRELAGNFSGAPNLLGGAAGVKMGGDSGLYLEYGFQKSLRNEFSASQVSMAWFWNR